MADDDRSRAAATTIVRVDQQPTALGCNAQHPEQAPARPEGDRTLRLGAATDKGPEYSPREDARERLLVIANLLPKRIGDLGIEAIRDAERSRPLHFDLRQFVWTGDRHTAQLDEIDQLEEGGIRADPDGERSDGDCREQWTASEHPQRMAEIANGHVDQREAARVAALLLAYLDAADRPQRRRARRVRRHAARDECVDLPFDVVLEFVIQLTFDRISSEERSQLQRKDMQPAFEQHVTPPAVGQPARSHSTNAVSPPSPARAVAVRYASANRTWPCGCSHSVSIRP